jgi:streptogramin lyase
MAYHDVQQIQKAGDELFVMASNSLYQYNLTDQSIYTYDKTNGMSDTHITHIAWSSAAGRLIVVYQNSNIDLIEPDGNVVNISDLYLKVITGDKTVSSVRIDGVYAYLICGFGIVKVNMERAEIADSYMPNHPEYPTNLPDENNSDYNQYIDVVSKLQPGGPKHNSFGWMRFINGKLYTCGGEYYAPAALQVWNGNDWSIYQETFDKGNETVSIQGPLCFDVRQTSQGEQLFLGARNGLFEFQDNNIVNYYNYQNSPIERFDGKSNDYEMVTGVKFDASNNLWFLNSQAPAASLIRLTDGTFHKHNHAELMKLNDGGFTNKSNGNLANIMIDSQGIMWFVNNNWVTPSFYQYDMQNDDITAYETFVNQDGTFLGIKSGVRCIVEDLNHDLWIGSNAGPFVLERNNIFEDNPTFIQVKVPRNDGTDYADYLLSGLDITAIAIDGGGRKWFGTNGNGAYLISADNMTQVQHFTTTNSKLLSDVVQSIAIDPKSGEVFFGTEQGLCSYMSDATAPAETMDDDHVYAYPNPVDFSNYSGLITVTGLTFNADVKITNAAGFLVAEGRSNGGLFTWDGKDKKGNRVGSGVYHVITATSDGKKGTVCRIAIVK